MLVKASVIAPSAQSGERSPSASPLSARSSNPSPSQSPTDPPMRPWLLTLTRCSGISDLLHCLPGGLCLSPQVCMEEAFKYEKQIKLLPAPNPSVSFHTTKDKEEKRPCIMFKTNFMQATLGCQYPCRLHPHYPLCLAWNPSWRTQKVSTHLSPPGKFCALP